MKSLALSSIKDSMARLKSSETTADRSLEVFRNSIATRTQYLGSFGSGQHKSDTILAQYSAAGVQTNSEDTIRD